MVKGLGLITLRERVDYFHEEDLDKSISNYECKIVVIRPQSFNDEDCIPQNQLFYAIGGSGCYPEPSDGAVMGRFIIDGEYTRVERCEVLGVLKKSVANEIGLCPCGNTLNENVSFSYEDNEILICKKCELSELRRDLDALQPKRRLEKV